MNKTEVTKGSIVLFMTINRFVSLSRNLRCRTKSDKKTLRFNIDKIRSVYLRQLHIHVTHKSRTSLFKIGIHFGNARFYKRLRMHGKEQKDLMTSCYNSTVEKYYDKLW